jgi:Uma2 family endonuclease
MTEASGGGLTASPPPSDPDRVVAGVIRAALEEQAPDDVVVAQGVEVRFGRRVTRTPDVLVVRAGEPGRRWFAPEEVLLAVEVESSDTPLVDRTTPAVYARHGIPHVWRITSEPPLIRVTTLREGAHQQVAAATHVIAFDPFPLEIDLVARLRRAAR